MDRVVGDDPAEDDRADRPGVIVSREAIKNEHGQTIGYIETMPDGTQKALDPDYQWLGTYDPERKGTQDASSRRWAMGNILLWLIGREARRREASG